jgi:hypothetical protein
MNLNGMSLTGGLIFTQGGGTPPSGGIVTSGLTINYDFSNAACYSGSGSTITDLSGNNNNSVYYDSPNFGGITPQDPGARFSTASGAPYFNGAMSTLESTGGQNGKLFGITSGVDLDTSWTVSVAMTMPAISGVNINYFWTNTQYNGPNGDNTGFQASVSVISGNNTIYWGGASPTASPNQTYIDPSLFGSIAIWDFVMVNAGGNNATLTLYKNGVQVLQQTGQAGYTPASVVPQPFIFGGASFNTPPTVYGATSTNVYNSILVYKNTALTASQIQQNYDARKAKYGLS